MSQPDENKIIENRALDIQIDLLHKSIEITDNAVTRLDDIISKLRNWAITIWTGSIALAINSGELVLIPFTACIPVLFWIANAFYSKHLLACTFYQKKVADKFNNTDEVKKILNEKDFGDFYVFNPLSMMNAEKNEYKVVVNYWKAFIYKDSKILYPALIIVSFVVWIILGYHHVK